MADIFISYASEDRNRVRPLAEALQSRGFNIWWDRSLAAGQDYASIIERELNAAKAVIVVWTAGSAASTFVRDEAGRARDEGRLVPVMLDAVQIPLGFGAFQAEDFTRWNGGAGAPQMQLLEEVLRAKLTGRDVDGALVARKRRKMMARVRLVSVLTVLALIIGIAVGGKYLFAPPQQHTDVRAQLLQLLADGQLTPEQAIQLAQLLEAGSLGETQNASLRSGEAPAASPGAAPSMAADAGSSGAVTEASFDATARETYQQAFLAVAQHRDAQVRLAAAQLAQPQTRDAAMQTLWTYAQAHPDDPLRDDIYLLCGSVGEANDNPLGQQALQQATSLSPGNANVWRMLSRSFQRVNRTAEATAAAQVSDGLQAQQAGNTAAAEENLQQALPALQASPELSAPVASALGNIAVGRGDSDAASARFAQAYSLREQAAQTAPNSAAAQGIDADAQQLVRSLDRSGRTEEACQRLQQAQQQHDVAAPDQATLDRCQRVLRAPLRNRVELAPALRQRATVTPAPAATP